MGTIREPKKKTSIEKKHRIIEKGFELICEKGFHNVTCVDIAKYAGVSTGIIYQYFKDKEDIFIHGIETHADSIMFPMLDALRSFHFTSDTITDAMHHLIRQLLKSHKIGENAHEELLAMTYSNRNIRQLMADYQYKATEFIVQILLENGFPAAGLKEKVHLAYCIVEEYCHEAVYHKHKELDYELMEHDVVTLVQSLWFPK